MAHHPVNAIDTNGGPRTGAAAHTQRAEAPQAAPRATEAKAEPQAAGNAHDTVKLSDELADEGPAAGQTTPAIAQKAPEAPGEQGKDAKKGDEADKKAKAEAEAERKKLEELERKKAELEKQLENQQLAGDKDGAQATQKQLEALDNEIKQIIDANQGGGANPVQKVQGAGAGPQPQLNETRVPQPAAGGGGNAGGGGAPVGGGGGGGGDFGGGPPVGGGGGGQQGGGSPVGANSGGHGQRDLSGAPDPTEGAKAANPNAEIPDFGKNPSKQQIGKMLEGASEKYGIPPNILKAVAYQESGWNPKALSFDGHHGKGVMQIDDRFHQFARTNEVFDPQKNIEYGAKYLSNLHNQTGSWSAALKRYNGGSDYPPKIMSLAQSQPWRQWGG